MQILSRRAFLTRTAGTAAALVAAPLAPLWADPASRRFRIGACDWSLGKMATPEAFAVAREIGLDGVQVSLGTEKDNMHLRQVAMQQAYRDAARESGLAIASLALGELNNIPFKSDPRTIAWVGDAVDVAAALGVRVILLAFFHKGDLRDDPAGTAEVVRRLKTLAPRAEKAGVILGLESWLSAEEHLDIIERVGSPAVQVYYDVCNSNDRGYDIYDEIRRLGKRGLICELHAKENGALLGQGKVDFRRVRAALDDIGYSGWIQIEGALPPGVPLVSSYRANLKFLRELFPGPA